MELQHLPNYRHGQPGGDVDRRLHTQPQACASAQIDARGRFGQPSKVFLPVDKGRQPGEHADPRGAETVIPAVGLAEIAAQYRGAKGADVDAHVEEREARIAPCIARTVEAPDQRGNIRLEKPDTDDDKRKGGVKDLQSLRIPLDHAADRACLLALDGHARVPGH